MADQDDQVYLSRAEAGEYLRVSPATVDRLPIPRSRLGRRVVFTRQDLDAYVASRRAEHHPMPVRTSLSASAWRAAKQASLKKSN